MQNDTSTTANQAALLALKQELLVHTDFTKHLLIEPTTHLMERWQAALATGSDSNLMADVDSLIVRLEIFKIKARRALPIANGGFQGREPSEWKHALAEHSIRITYDDEGEVWGFDGSGPDGFDSEEDAINAALQAHPEIVEPILGSACGVAGIHSTETSGTAPNDPLRALVFRPDGRLRGVSYCKPSTLRGAIITVKPTVNTSGVKGKVNTYLLDNMDFHKQYAIAVKYIADHHGIPPESPMRAEMLATSSLYLNHYRLRLRDVNFKTAFHPG